VPCVRWVIGRGVKLRCEERGFDEFSQIFCNFGTSILVMSLNIDFPDFNHPEVRAFYEHDLSIPKEKVAEILQLPRETLIKDMETILMDTINRDKFFRGLDDTDQWWSFQFHTLWVLVELEAVEALPTLLTLLKQDDDFSSYWWVDYVGEGLWEIYYHLADNKLEALKEVLLAPGDWISRIVPSSVAEQIFLHHPEREQEILDWYRAVLDAFLEMEDENDALDGEVISSIVVNLIAIQADELLPKISALYERGFVYDGIVGEMESIEADIKNPEYRDGKRDVTQSIYDRYEDAMSWHGYLMKYDEAYREQHTYKPSSSLSPKPIPKTEKVGRNAPCPCGSGKKYKKCCLKK